MIEILDKSGENFIAIKVKGKITQKDYDNFNPVLERTVRNYNKPKMYAEVFELDLPSFQAVWEEIKNLPYYNKFEKCAIAGTKDWYEPLADFFDKSMSPQVKYFDYEQRGKALEWLQES